MSSSQINYLATAKRINPVISIYSPVTGVVDGTDSMLASNGPMHKQPRLLECKGRRLY
jgi:Cu(I)/Ag(I) efflux system membrane fusion protein